MNNALECRARSRAQRSVNSGIVAVYVAVASVLIDAFHAAIEDRIFALGCVRRDIAAHVFSML